MVPLDWLDDEGDLTGFDLPGVIVSLHDCPFLEKFFLGCSAPVYYR